ncbi:NAD(P)/FAD-dependent oxidoreductase [Flavobacterium sp. PL002]|uniref:NAD(P)/FAD-dependent oxidoreductase n=1 Tax=Flavobacterium sp. PL002 TaxID=1897058 RepID=UPI0017883C5D|nr:NAD(P)/FAD-dependent oxidoreductase [Flavobacterium sp. PL002]MBE0393225.1 Kynurenine 3-monooxygenase [Flavobacterium sp. PL002]
MKQTNAIVIVGGGLAGLTAAIHLTKARLDVVLIEKNEYPKHKVCGEYISNEVIPYFNWLGIDILKYKPTIIDKLQFSTANGSLINCQLPLGGFGISRYLLDAILYKKAIANGCKIIQDTVESCTFLENEFTITTSKNTVFKSEIVLGAFGKRANIDVNLNRDFIQKKSNWLAVKAHYSGDFHDDLVGLHNFNGGYCGVSKVENNSINICYLADYKTFKKYKNIQDYQDKNIMLNPHLKKIFLNSTLLFEKPLTISQISFEKKKIVDNHILMIGDTAGLIHPLCGNGMAMAIHSAKIASELIIYFYKSNTTSRSILEKEYEKSWNTNFKKRLKMGRFLATILQKQKLANVLLRILIVFPFLLPKIIKSTHGKPILIQK